MVYAQLPEPDDAVAAGEDCGALESVKGRDCSSGLPDLRDFMLKCWFYTVIHSLATLHALALSGRH